MADRLEQALYAEYADGQDAYLLRNTRAAHLTLYSGDSYAFSFKRTPRDKVYGRSSRPTDIHIYDIVEDHFVLELRNIPTSTTVETILIDSGAEVADGQTHSTYRLHLRASNADFLRRLGDLIRRIPARGRIDRFSGLGSQSYQVGRALLRLARVLESAL